jgi:Cu+-exporting ATPase
MRAALLVLWIGCGGPNPAREVIAAPHATPDGAWTCPMHPEVHRDAAGSCPTCGMPLVSASPGTPR